MSTDEFNVTGVITPADPVPGQPIKLTISGENIHTESVPVTIGPFTLDLVAKKTDPVTGVTTVVASGTGVIEAFTYNDPVVTHNPIELTGVTDTTGRTTWTVELNNPHVADAIAPYPPAAP